MKRNGAWIEKHNWWVSALVSFLWGLWAFLNDFNKIDPTYDNWHHFILTGLEYGQRYSYILLIALLISTPVWYYLVKTNQNWTVIDKLLNQVRNKVFNHCSGEPKEHHQITLFEYKTILWRSGCVEQSVRNIFLRNPKKGWLVPVTRTSGKDSTSIFVVDHDSRYCEGICGEAWASGDIAMQLALPRVTKDSSQQTIKNYALKGNCSIDLVERKVRNSPKVKAGKAQCILPRSIVAFPIGEDSGVQTPKYILVFDSRNKEGLSATIREDYSVVNQLLGSLLEGV